MKGNIAMSYDSSERINPKTFFVLLAIALFVIWEFFWNFGPKQGLHQTTITVCSVEDSPRGNDHEYRVYTSDGTSDNTYKIKDSWLGVKRRNSADDYGRLKRELEAGPVTIDATVKGERWHTPTNLQNIVKFTRSAKQTPEMCKAS